VQRRGRQRRKQRRRGLGVRRKKKGEAPTGGVGRPVREERARLGLREEVSRAWPMQGKGERGECWASGLAWAREKREERGRDRGLGLVAGLLLSFLSFSSFLFLLYTQTIQTNLFELK
jgi:hypothetical protein